MGFKVEKNQGSDQGTEMLTDFLLAYEDSTGPFGCEVIMYDGTEIIGTAIVSRLTKLPELIVEGDDFTEFVLVQDVRMVIV